MKKLIWIFSVSMIVGVLASCNQNSDTSVQSDGNTESTQQNADKGQLKSSDDMKPIQITAGDFKNKIWDYENDPEAWAYKGDMPCVVDFYADWCKPCKRVAPIMDDLADYYKDRVIFYKVNTDDERELSTVFQVSSIPAILFAPGEGKPAMQAGAMTKDDYIKIIDEFVLKIDKKNNDNIKTES